MVHTQHTIDGHKHDQTKEKGYQNLQQIFS